MRFSIKIVKKKLRKFQILNVKNHNDFYQFHASIQEFTICKVSSLTLMLYEYELNERKRYSWIVERRNMWNVMYDPRNSGHQCYHLTLFFSPHPELFLYLE
uniref:Uncharacterized protein n=1 Tax=Cacopsylla melanoneura TaxID=428564 RepID=A0A8D8PVV1_9HEMI